ncbi:MAG: hypothetical protein QXU79_04315, partial [Candidatus Micrarchaeaceae archaeon]
PEGYIQPAKAGFARVAAVSIRPWFRYARFACYSTQVQGLLNPRVSNRRLRQGGPGQPHFRPAGRAWAMDDAPEAPAGVFVGGSCPPRPLPRGRAGHRPAPTCPPQPPPAQMRYRRGRGFDTRVSIRPSAYSTQVATQPKSVPVPRPALVGTRPLG